MASNGSEMISETEDQHHHSMRESAANVRVRLDIDELKSEQWVSVGHERNGFASQVTVRYGKFCDAYENKRRLEDLKGLEEAVEGAF